jgi:hypothetical protein
MAECPAQREALNATAARKPGATWPVSTEVWLLVHLLPGLGGRHQAVAFHHVHTLLCMLLP